MAAEVGGGGPAGRPWGCGIGRSSELLVEEEAKAGVLSTLAARRFRDLLVHVALLAGLQEGSLCPRLKVS